MKRTTWIAVAAAFAVAIALWMLCAGAGVGLRGPAVPAGAPPSSADGEPAPVGVTGRARVAPPPAASAAADAGAPALSPGVILVVGPDGAPVAGADVETLALGGADPTVARSTPRRIGTTDERGRVMCPDDLGTLPAIVRASHPDFAPSAVPFRATDDAVVVRLGRGFAIEGTVVDEEGRPVANSAVDASVVPTTNGLGTTLGVVGTWTRRAQSSADGAFRIVGVPPACFGVVTARADGYTLGETQWTSSSARPVRVVVGRAFTATVRVADRAGTPLAGAYVAAFDGPLSEASPDGIVRSVVAFREAGDGKHVCDDLVPGWCRVLVAHPGHRIVVVDACGFQRGTAPVEVVLDATPGLRGRVIDAVTRAPVAGATVGVVPIATAARPGSSEERAYQEPSGRMDGAWFATSAADGTFAVAVAGPGDDVVVSIRAPGYQHHHLAKRGITADDVREISLRPLAADDCSGRVVSTSGQAVAGAIVRGASESAVAGGDGRFRLVMHPSGAWITVVAPGFASRLVAAPGNGTRGGGLGTVDFGDLELAPLVAVRGVVVDGDGAPVGGVSVSAQPETQIDLPPGTMFRGDLSVSDADGLVTLHVTPGDPYRVATGPGRAGSTAVVGGAGDADGAGHDFRLVVGPDAGADAGTIRGRLRMEEGPWTATYAAVAAMREGRREMPPPPIVRPDGSFEIDGVEPGRWELRVSSAAVVGTADAVDVPARGTAVVVIVCRPRDPVVPVETAPLTVRVDDAPPELAVWATSAGGRRPSTRLRRTPESAWTATVATGGTFTVWAADIARRRAGVVTGLAHDGAARAAAPPRVELVPAGRVVLTPPADAFAERWVEVRDAAGSVVWSGPERELPATVGEGSHLDLPPGDWTVEISTGLARRSPRTSDARVVAGGTVRLE